MKGDFSLRRPTDSQERGWKKRRRPASLEMTMGEAVGSWKSTGKSGSWVAALQMTF